MMVICDWKNEDKNRKIERYLVYYIAFGFSATC